MALTRRLKATAANRQYQIGPFVVTEQQILNVFNKNVVESLTTTKQLIAADGGKTFSLDLAAGFTVTLPSIADAGAGWNCKFIVGTNCTSNDYVITEKTTVDTDKIIGKINELEVDTSSDGPSSTGCTTLTLPNAADTVGDSFDFYCDGTNWHLNGTTVLDGGAVLA